MPGDESDRETPKPGDDLETAEVQGFERHLRNREKSRSRMSPKGVLRCESFYKTLEIPGRLKHA